MATVTTSAPPTLTVALLPGKPETKMRLVDLQRKERQEQKTQDKKLDASKNQPQPSTVVNISAKARELSSAAPVNQTSSAAKAGSSTDHAAKNTEVTRAAPVAQPPSAVNTGSTAAPATPAKKA